MNSVPLEDTWQDVVGKAQRGRAISDEEIARRAGVPVEEWVSFRGGEFDEAVASKAAPLLGLGTKALGQLARNEWHPRPPGELPGFQPFSTHFDGMKVNSYVVWDLSSRNGLCFDTGADASAMILFAAEREIRLQMVLLTHGHPDHIADLQKLLKATDGRAFASKLEGLAGVETFEPGRNFRCGRLIIGTRLTCGHSPGGITYVLEGLPRRVAVVGDALFAGSMGGGNVSYEDALRTNRLNILSLPEDTILCPGHGPLTTVEEEKVHNPFFGD